MSWASLIGAPRNVSISRGRRAVKSWYMVLGVGVGWIMASMVCSWMFSGKTQP
jgi:hypothetical protein